MSAEYIIEMRDVNKSFYGAKVLYDVNFKLKRGEIRALLGENGVQIVGINGHLCHIRRTV